MYFIPNKGNQISVVRETEISSDTLFFARKKQKINFLQIFIEAKNNLF
jgi:hypothetical protein